MKTDQMPCPLHQLHAAIVRETGNPCGEREILQMIETGEIQPWAFRGRYCAALPEALFSSLQTPAAGLSPELWEARRKAVEAVAVLAETARKCGAWELARAGEIAGREIRTRYALFAAQTNHSSQEEYR